MKRVLKYKLVSSIFFVSFAFVLGGALWSYSTLRGYSYIILHYAGNINQYGNVWDLLRVGALGLGVLLLSYWMALDLEERDWFLGKLLAAGVLFFSILLFIGFAAIISVN